MTVTIEVYRDAGDHEGDEVSEELLGNSLAAALARGAAELDSAAQDVMTTTLGLRRGDLIGITDPTQGAEWRGKIVSIEHQFTPGDAPTFIEIERPIDE